MRDKPIVECMYGWGQVLRLYPDTLEVGGTFYDLDGLISAHPLYRRILCISSARLELHFKRKTLVLRGIVAVESAQKIIDYINGRCVSRQDTKPTSPETPTHTPSLLPQHAAPSLPTITSYESLQEYAQAPTMPVEVPRLQHMLQEQRGYRTKRAQRGRLLREHGFDIERLEQLLRAGALPQVQVPVRLLSDECAHYRTDATLSGEPLIDGPRYRYQVKDQGVLILTNKRVIYLGHKCQIVLSYGRILHVSRLQGAIAFLAEHRSRREIFQVRYPLECAMYLEYILKRFQQQESLLLHEYSGGDILSRLEERDDEIMSDSEAVSCNVEEWNLSTTPVTESRPTNTSDMEE